MIKRLVWFCWYVRTSYQYCEGNRDWNFWKRLFPTAFSCTKQQIAWNALTPEQREAWYLSGEGRLLGLKTKGAVQR